MPASSPFPKRFPLVNTTDGALLLALRICSACVGVKKS